MRMRMRIFPLVALLHISGMLFAHTTSVITDEEALLEFKSQVSQQSRVALASWNHGSLHLCNWTGVTCGRKHQRVTRLSLGSMKLTGVISPAIGNLSFLRSLELSSNSFQGTIPQEVGKLSRLRYLNLSYNVLGGGIPIGLSNCSSLLVLDLSFNRLVYNVPAELGSLYELVNVNLGKNNLTGNLPPFLGNMTNLKMLGFAYNNMDGEIPDSIAKLTKMVRLQLARNNFLGAFPRAFRNLSSLEFLSIGSNKFSEYGVGGEASIMGDVFSFGVLILEMFTGKRPTDELFSDDWTLQKYTKLALSERVMEVADQSVLLNAGARVRGAAIAECLESVLQVGLKCSEESPTKRMMIVEAFNELVTIRERFVKAKRAGRQ